jgi:DNA (cytosine-5)-methyltransferase 1
MPTSSNSSRGSGKQKREKKQPAIVLSPPPRYSTLSLFSGCGGLDLGFTGNFTYHGTYYAPHPFDIIQAYDFDKRCVETYQLNIGNHITCADLATYPVEDFPRVDILIGGFPCQEFSSCGPKQGLDSERGQLYKVFVRYIEHYQPKIVVAENVPHLERMQKGQVLETILADLRQAGPGYHYQVWSLYAPDYGVPQKRRRLVLVGVRNDLLIAGVPDRPPMSHPWDHRSVLWALGDLEHITDGSIPNQDQFFRANTAHHGNGQGDERNRADEPAYTIRANPKSRVQFHYRLARRLTIRECARLQTFPDSFIFPHSMTANIKQIGNAVPPVLAHRVGHAIAEYLKKVDGISCSAEEISLFPEALYAE